MSTQKAMLRHGGYSGSAEVSVDDECMHGRILHIDDIVTYEGQTVPELQREFAAAVDRYLAHCRKIGKAPGKPYSGTLNVRLGADLHRAVSEYASARGANINEAIVRAVRALVDASETAPVVPPQQILAIGTAAPSLTVRRVDIFASEPHSEPLSASSAFPAESPSH